MTKIHNNTNVKVTLAVLGEKIDNLGDKADAHYLTMKEHTTLDDARFGQIDARLEPLATFRWKVYGGIAAITALIGLIELLHSIGILK